MSGETDTVLWTDVDAATVAASLGYAVALGAYVAWMTADFLPRWLSFALVVGGGGYLLYAQPTAGARRQYAIYVLAGALAATPLFVVLPDALNADRMGVSAASLLATTANGLLFVVFWLPAAAVAYLGYRHRT